MKKLVIVIGLLAFMACSSSKDVGKEPALENTNWVLVEMEGKAYEPNTEAKPVTLTLQAEGNRIVGFGGCNSFSGSYTLDGNTIQFTLASTKMFCNDTRQVEDYLFMTLTKVKYSIEGEVLTLKNTEGQSVKFRKS